MTRLPVQMTQSLIYICLVISAVGVAIASALDQTAWITARQLYALWALAFLLASLLIGPLVAVFPKTPLKNYLLAARRSIGVGAFFFAVAHVICYLVPILLRNWRDVISPGTWWIIGLIFGISALSLMVPLTWTSRDAAVRTMGAARWKRLHRLVYVLLPIALLHAVLVGSDFGAHRAPDVHGEPDVGSLIVFSFLSLGWLMLFFMRHRRTPAPSPASC